MQKGVDFLLHQDYPGRLIILGKSLSGENVVIYGITARKTKARKLVHYPKDNEIKVESTDVAPKGDPNILLYSSFFLGSREIIVGDGHQTNSVSHCIGKNNALSSLVEGHSGWTYEPDSPNYSPRISGCIVDNSAALGIIKKGDNLNYLQHFFSIPLIRGKGFYISSFRGDSVTLEAPLPSFEGEPIFMDIPGRNPQETLSSIYKIFAPKNNKQDNKQDYRVAFAVAYQNPSTRKVETAIFNKYE